MAVSSMIRRASSPVLRLAVQSVRSPSRSFHGSASMLINGCKRTKLSQAASLQFLRFSSSATKKYVDEELVRVINSGIQCRDVPDVPSGFSLTIQGNSEYGRTICLVKQDHNETIEVKVDMSTLEDTVHECSESDDDDTNDDCDRDNDSDDDSDGRDNDDSDDYSDYENDGSDESHVSEHDNNDDQAKKRFNIPMLVNVSKGGKLFLEFNVNASPDNISIKGFSIKESKGDRVDEYELPDFSDMGWQLQSNLFSYLEVRGIKSDLVDFLHKSYMVNKKREDEMRWLEKLKMFILK